MGEKDSELLKAIFDKLESTERNLKNEIKELKKFNECLVDKFNSVEKRVNDQHEIILGLQQQINRKNLIIHGIIHQEDDDNNLEQDVLEMLNNKLRMNLTTESFEQVHRLGKNNKGGNVPIKVELTKYKDKMEIVKKKAMLKGTRIYINNDLPRELRIRGMEERRERRERSIAHNSRKHLREQSSEESDIQIEKITQELKKLKEGRRHVTTRNRMEISQNGNVMRATQEDNENTQRNRMEHGLQPGLATPFSGQPKN